jgi:short chain dehydrogenase
MVTAGNGGRIIAVTRAHEHQPGIGSGAYDAAKHGLGGLIKTLALELAQHDITANSVGPGEIATDMTGNDDTNPHTVDRPGIPLGRPSHAARSPPPSPSSPPPPPATSPAHPGSSTAACSKWDPSRRHHHHQRMAPRLTTRSTDSGSLTFSGWVTGERPAGRAPCHLMTSPACADEPRHYSAVVVAGRSDGWAHTVVLCAVPSGLSAAVM